jgi:hypothetical protein
MAEGTIASNGHPEYRRLWVYAIDPWAETTMATAVVSRCVLPVRWERLGPGPVGEYIEVVDVDPSSNCVYDPVDLEDRYTIASGGLPPSEGSPQFHQQMVYAVIMKTIDNFERALGRQILWAARGPYEEGKRLSRERQYVPRLRIYPHALREANAYYSADKKALLLGYFSAPTGDDSEDLPGGMIFTCLSHDIIAHETTHAILDGIHRRLLEPTNPDMLAFHEAFADIVATFQHFTLPGLVLDQICQTRGDLRLNSLLTSLAEQFGRATQRGSALRNALGRFDEQGERLPPDPSELARTTESHARGAILVAAVFDAFLGIYSARVQDLRRIATGGTGVLPKGDIHPDLANRFADEAIKAAQRVLTICIRALDYLPPVDITFGDYLRALITADADLVPDDRQRYRVAFIEAFRTRGIFPYDVRAMGEDTLHWRRVGSQEWKRVKRFLPPRDVLRTMITMLEDSPYAPESRLDADTENEMLLAKLSGEPDELTRLFLRAYWNPQKKSAARQQDDAEASPRKSLYYASQQFARFIYLWLAVATRKATDKELDAASWQFGLDLRAFRDYLRRQRRRPRKGIARFDQERARDGAIEVHDVRPTSRVRPDGRRTKTEILVILTQKQVVALSDGDAGSTADSDKEPTFYKFRGGCTLLIDPDDGRIRYAIAKRITSEYRQARIDQFLRGRIADLGDVAFDQFPLHPGSGQPREPLAMLHRTFDDGAC